MKAWFITDAAVVIGMLMAPALGGQVSSAGGRAADTRAPGEPVRSAILREIDDPATGRRWLLERDLQHPGGPGHLILAVGGSALVPRAENQDSSAGEIPGVPVIHAGDAVTLTTHTAVMDAELQAVALAPATVGAAFPVRWKIGGRVVQAVALGAGRAEWTPGSGEMR